MSNFWKQFEEFRKKQSGGGGVICKADIAQGYRVYTSDQEGSFFPFSFDDETAAQEKAIAYAANMGAGKPQWIIRIKALKDTALKVQDGAWSPVTWKSDMYHDRQLWKEDEETGNDIVISSLTANNIDTLPVTTWCRLGFKPSPYHVAQGESGKTDEDQDGNPKFPTVAYIVETFENEAAARAAISSGTTATTATTSPAPEGWSQDDWNAVLPAIKAELQNGTPKAAVATKFGYPIETLVEA